MKFSLNGSTIRTTPILTQIEAAAAAGFEALEVWFDKVDEHVAAGNTVAEVRNALDDHGLAVPTCIYLGDWFDSSGESHRHVLDECKRRIAIAAELGAPHVIAGPPLGKADYELGARNYRELLEIGAEFGVKPSMEFLGFVDQLNTIEDALEVMTKSGHPDASTVLDPAHIHRGGSPMESISKLTDSQIAVAHFDDVVADDVVHRGEQLDGDRVWPGEGVYDLARYIKLIEATGYDRYLSLELFREDHWARDPFEVTKEGMEKMRAVVESTVS